MSVREIRKRSGLSKSMAQDIISGRKQVTEKTAEKHLGLVRRIRTPEAYVIVNGQKIDAIGANQRTRSKIATWLDKVTKAARVGDFSIVKKDLKRSDLEILIIDDNGRKSRVHLESNPSTLRLMHETQGFDDLYIYKPGFAEAA